MKCISLTSFIVFILFVSLTTHAQDLHEQTTEGSTIDSTLPKEVPYTGTAEIAFELENTMRFIKEARAKVETYRNVDLLDTLFLDLSSRVNQSFEEFDSYNKNNLSKYFLSNSKRVWLSYRSQLDGWQKDVSGRVLVLMEISQNIKKKEQLWTSTNRLQNNTFLPDNLTERITNSQKDLNEVETSVFEVVTTLSILESNITEKIIELDSYIEVIDNQYSNYRGNLFKATHPIIWKTQLKDSYRGTMGGRVKKAWSETARSVSESMPSFKGNLFSFILWSLLFVASIMGLRYLYFKQNPSKSSAPNNKLEELIIRSPGLSIIYLVLFLFVIIFNNLPLSLSVLINTTGIIITYFLLRHYFSEQGKSIIVVFTVLLVLHYLEIIWLYFGNYIHIYVMVEASIGLLLTSRFFKPSFVDGIVSRKRYRNVIYYLRYPIFLLYIIAFIVNFFGLQNLAILLLKTSTQLAASIIIFISAWEISKSIVHILIEVLKGLKIRNSDKYIPLFQNRLSWFVNLLWAFIWLDALLIIVELETPFYEGLDLLMNQERNLGSLVYSYNSIFQFIVIMLITWGLISVIRIIFDEGNFKRRQQLRGVPAAISTTLRLIIGFAGFFLALTGAGIDLTKISILVGAFGVGIGFGLQNIVNNFISGLILIYERPIQAGDTIEISELLGVVKSIGIRSSNVRTFDGAEVVVPNSILVSDQLINWTLSDDKRRLEVVVGVKYGTDPKLVIQLLKEVAENNPMVAKRPKPNVLFNEFGDSSLNFRLLCWVLFENGIQTKSDLSVAIDAKFKEYNIEIPFPQMDLHVLDMPGNKPDVQTTKE